MSGLPARLRGATQLGLPERPDMADRRCELDELDLVAVA